MSTKDLLLTYTINLAGNAQRQAVTFAKTLETLSQQQQKAMQATDKAIGQTEAHAQKAAQTVEASAKREVAALTTVTAAANQTNSAIGKIADSGTVNRLNTHLAGVARRLDEIKRKAAGIDLGKLASGIATGAGAARNVAAGVAAGGAATVAMLRKPVSFDEQLGRLANTAYGGESLATRLAGKKELEADINKAVREGGGTREQAAETLGNLLSSGEFSAAQAKAMLPVLQKASTASGASSEELASIALAAKRTGIAPEQLEAALSKAMRAGELGGFELKDMARWLPQLLTAGKELGYTGMGGFEKMLAYAQASVTTAGTKDEAGNNLLNLLLKANSEDTAKDFAKQGIDLRGTLANAQKKGIDPLQAFVGATDKLIAKDTNYARLQGQLNALQKQAATQQGSEKADTLQKMQAIYQSGAIGKVLQDRQAMMDFLAIKNNPELIKRVMTGVQGETGQSTQVGFDVMKSGTAYKAQAAENEADIARSEAFKKVEGPMNSLLDATVNLAREYPTVTTAMVGLTGATTAATGALAALSALEFLKNLGGGKLPPPGGGNLPGPAGAPGAAAGAVTLGRLVTVGAAAGAVAAPLAIASVTSKEELDTLATSEAKKKKLAQVFTQDEIAAARKNAPWYEFGSQPGDAMWERANQERVRRGGKPVPFTSDEEIVARSASLTETRARLQRAEAGPSPVLANAVNPAALAAGGKPEPQKVEVGTGKVQLDVRVLDERTSVSALIPQQPDLFKLNMGATNPAGGQ